MSDEMKFWGWVTLLVCAVLLSVSLLIAVITDAARKNDKLMLESGHVWHERGWSKEVVK